MKLLFIFFLISLSAEAFPDCTEGTHSVYYGDNYGVYDSARTDPSLFPKEEHYGSLYKLSTYDHFIMVHRYAYDGSIGSFYYSVRAQYFACKTPYEHIAAPTCTANTYPKLSGNYTSPYGNLSSSGGSGCNLSDFTSEYLKYSQMYNPNTNNEFYVKTSFVDYIRLDNMIGYIHCPDGSDFSNPQTIYALLSKETYRCVPYTTPDTDYNPPQNWIPKYDLYYLNECSGEEIGSIVQCSAKNGATFSKRTNCCTQTTCFVPPCDQNDTKFPEPPENYKPDPSLDSLACAAIPNAQEQTRRVNCQDEHRCLVPDNVCVDNEKVGSYVSPKGQVFHEDISIIGADFGLHYQSRFVDEGSIIAKGWGISIHHRLVDDNLRLGFGAYIAPSSTYVENNHTIVVFGSNELIFDTNNKHLKTRDLYTKETSTTFTYDNTDRLLTITDKYGQTSYLHRDTNGTLTSIVAPTGQTTYVNIDDKGDLLEVQYEDTSSYTFAYEKHLMTVETEPNGNRFLHFFDDKGKVVKVIDAEQGEWLFGSNTAESYGSHTVTRASGDVVTYKNHFLENGILKTEKTLPTGDIILYENAVDDSISSTTICGQKSTNTYLLENGILAKDPLQDRRILKSSTQTTPSGLSKTTNFTTNYSFDANNTLISIENITETNGATTTSLKDYNQSTSILTSPEGIITQATYDTHTQLPLKVQYANLEPTFYTYDTLGRVIKSKQGKRTLKYSYNEKGNIEEIHNVQRDTKTSYIYDLRDRVIQTTYDDGNTEHYSYDANGNLIKRTVPTPADHTFTYNGVNKRTSNTSPLQKQTTYTYDKQRRVTKITKPSGKSIDTNYVNGRITAISTAEGTTNYSYECQSNISNINKGSENFSFTYDGTLVTSISQSGQVNQTISYTYNNDFNPISITYANQTQNYDYNDDDELTQIGDYNISREKRNRVLTLTNGTYKKVSKINKYGELRFTQDNVLKVRLKRNLAGQIVRKVEKLQGERKKVYKYTYDDRARLTEVKKRKNVVEIYTYDNNGNRASATVNNQTITASYTLDDNLVVYGDNTYRYDEDGYLEEKITPEGTTTYSYGTLGELLSVVTPTQTITYKHNALNQRVAKLVNGVIVKKYLWANLTTLLAVYDSSDALVQRFEYADNRMPMSMISNGTKYYLHYDQVGSLRAISDTNHNIIKEITYDTFGNILSNSNPSFKIPFGFAGGLYDSDTQLTRFGYRDYDAETGKWTAKDPIRFGGGDSNLYGYVLGDPVGFVDPTGEVLIPALGWIRITLTTGAISKIIKNTAYEKYLYDEVRKFKYNIDINCGCSKEELVECSQRKKDIEKNFLKLLSNKGIKKLLK